MTEHPLDNPIWSALTTNHAHLALGDGSARRYPLAITALTGLRAADSTGFADLAAMVAPGSVVPLFLASPEPPPFDVVYSRDIAQMVCAQPIASPAGFAITPLGVADVAEMLALVELTKPGPFGPRTIQFGDFFGIRVQGQLAAMAGTRLRPQGFTEISAVCTHPDFQRRGYGEALVRQVAAVVQARHEIACLHVKTDNAQAVRTYEKLGFIQRRVIHLRTVRLPG